MDPVTAILTALGVGAVAALKDTASQAVKDAYAGLKSLVHVRLGGKPEAEQALAMHEQDPERQDPETWETPLRKALAEIKAGQDAALIEQARKVLELVMPQQLAQADNIYQFHGEVKGSAFGDHPHVENKWGSE